VLVATGVRRRPSRCKHAGEFLHRHNQVRMDRRICGLEARSAVRIADRSSNALAARPFLATR
jgi:hypothetical protein